MTYTYNYNNSIIMDKCDFCNKKKAVTMKCPCGGTYCLKHYTPNNHNCKNILSKDDGPVMSSEATGAFKKIDKI